MLEILKRLTRAGINLISKPPLFFSLLKAVFVLFGAISIVAAAILIAAAIPDIHHRWLLANY